MTAEPLPAQQQETTMAEEEEEQDQQQSSNNSNYYYSNDYDYLGTGGFLIECCDGTQILGVTSTQRTLVEKNCCFIKNCFRHNTFLESSNGILRKPDWSLCIARHLIEVLTKGVTTLPTLDLYKQLINAGDQILLDLKLCNFVNYMDPIITTTTTPSPATTTGINNNNNNDKESYYHHDYHDNDRFLDLIQPNKYRFKFKGNIKSYQWIKLLTHHGILLNRKETNYVVKLINNNNNNNDHNDHDHNNINDHDHHHHVTSQRRQLDTRNTEYLIHADQTLQAIFDIQQILYYFKKEGHRRGLSSPLLEEEKFSIYFETTTPISKDQHELIDRLAGGSAYIRTCADAHKKKTEGYTVESSFDVLRRAIKPLVILLVPEKSTTSTSNIHHHEAIIKQEKQQQPPSYQSRKQDDRSTTTTTTNNNQKQEPNGQHHDDDEDDDGNNEDDPTGTGTDTGTATTTTTTTSTFIEGDDDDDAAAEVIVNNMNPNCMIHCSLRIDNPTPDTLGRFINACCQTQKTQEEEDESKTVVVKDYPSTLGMDASINRYFVRKTMRDVYSILEYMSDYSTSSKIMSQDFTLYELSGEDQPF